MPSLFSATQSGRRYLAPSALILFAFAAASQAQVVIPKSPQIGSSNPVTAEPRVSRPTTKPCKVALFNNLEFADFSSKSYSYTPPADCPGPWAKVVFTADFTVTAGIQYDRTAEFFLGHANIFYGTTAEPSPSQSPSWHVEHDVTDLSPIFTTAQTGEADLGNVVNSTYTGIIYANAALEFYPASAKYPAASAPDLVVPMPNAAGGAVALNNSASQLTQTMTLPTNVERAYLDVIAQSQSGDEFWYTCVPNDVSGPLESCGGTPFRETEISIDGTPAGVAPVYPWIYTGGLDPYLWFPIPGIETLDFKPFRVDLTPFAGVLSNGSPHTVALSVFNANGYFLATANLLLYTDHGSDFVTGAVTKNTLTAAPTPTVNEDLHIDPNGLGTATVAVGSDRYFSIAGYVKTSHGTIYTDVEQKSVFLSTQKFKLTSSIYAQNITQTSVTDLYSNVNYTSASGKSVAEITGQHFSYPVNINIGVHYNADGSGSQTVTTHQADETGGGVEMGTFKYSTLGKEDVRATDTLLFDASGNLTGKSGSQSSATYTRSNSNGQSYYRGLTSKDNVLTGITTTPQK